MKVISVPRINALGKKGPENAPEKILGELGIDAEKVLVGNEDISADEKEIYSVAKKVFNEGAVFIGGDHSITYPIFKAFNEENKDAFLIVFDAHADCMPPMKESTHEEWLRAVVEGGFDPAKIILIGARKIEQKEKEFLSEKKIKVFSEISDLESVGNYIIEKVKRQNVYVSVDVDVLDLKFAQGVNYPEPKGLSLEELFYLLKRIFSLKNLKVLDVVEVVPEKDEKSNYQTVKIAARIVQDFIDSKI